MSKKTKKIILIVLLLIAIIFGLYKIITYQEKTFNKDLELNENIIVKNYSTVDFVDTILYVGLDYMNIQDVTVLVYDLTDKMRYVSDDIELKANILFLNGYYYVWIDNELSRYKTIKVLSHELVHLSQYYNEKLFISINNELTWYDSIFNLSEIDYFDRPWEIEAYDKEDSIYNDLKNMLY